MNAVVVPKAPEALDVSSEQVPVPSPSSALTSTLMRFAAVSSSYFLTSSCAGLTKLFSRYSWAACRIRRSLLLLRARMSLYPMMPDGVVAGAVGGGVEAGGEV